MQVNNVKSNGTSFGAKLVIQDSQKILSGQMRTIRHSKSKVRAFSKDELKQIKNGFEERTKNIKGKMQLKPYYVCCERSPYHNDELDLTQPYDKLSYFEDSYLGYFPNNNKCNGAIMGIQLLSNMPKSVDEFVDKLVGAFDVLRNRFMVIQEMNNLQSRIEALKKTIDNTSVSEMDKHFKVSGFGCIY